MKKFLLFLIVAIVVGLVVLAGWWQSAQTVYKTSQSTANPARTLVYAAHYQCDNNQTIEAHFYTGGPVSKPIAGEPPVPTGSAEVDLSDGRSLTLTQTLSADGARYANSQSSQPNSAQFVLWSKGNGVLVQDPATTNTYTNCISVAPETDDLVNVYHNGTLGYTIRYPKDWTMDEGYSYDGNGPNTKALTGVKFHIPAAMATGTNLSAFATGISVESVSNVAACTAAPFLPKGAATSTLTSKGVNYATASTSEAAAGNLYQELVFARLDTHPCLAIRYLIHSSRIENYDPNTITAFNVDALLNTFAEIRDSLVVAQ